MLASTLSAQCTAVTVGWSHLNPNNYQAHSQTLNPNLEPKPNGPRRTECDKKFVRKPRLNNPTAVYMQATRSDSWMALRLYSSCTGTCTTFPHTDVIEKQGTSKHTTTA